MLRAPEPFFRVAQTIFGNRKFDMLTNDAQLLYFKTLAFCTLNKLDGRVTERQLEGLIRADDGFDKKMIAARLGVKSRSTVRRLRNDWRTLRDELVAAELLDEGPGDCAVHDYNEWQLTNEDQQEQRASASARQRKSRAKRKARRLPEERPVTELSHVTVLAEEEEEEEDKQQEQEATTQPLKPDRDPAEIVVVESAPVPTPADLLSATTTLEPVAEMPATTRSEPQEPGPQFEPEDVTRTQPRVESRKTGDGVGGWAEFVAWAPGAGLNPAQGSDINREKLASMTVDGPIPLAVMDSVARDVLQDSSVTNKNAGLALSRLPAALAAFRGRDNTPLTSVDTPNGPTAEDMRRERENAESRGNIDWEGNARRVSELVRELSSGMGA